MANRPCWKRSLPKLEWRSSAQFPIDAPKARGIRTLGQLGFRLMREQEHIAMVRENPDGTRTPLTMPNHPHIKAPPHGRSALNPASRERTF